MQISRLSFVDRAKIAIDDPTLQIALTRARAGLIDHTDVAMAHPDYQIWRDEGQQIRDQVLDNLDTLLTQFEQNAIASGAKVHWAKDAIEARSLVAEIANQHGCKRAIKSKSMLTEEIQLNAKLSQSNIEILETDLGEYIVQISDSYPSHIIAPILHMRKEEISELFAEHHAKPKKHEAAELVTEAREILRPKMLAGDLGITGANFFLAETGSSVIVTNEGNGRYCCSIPKVRITIGGIEKIIPSTKQLATLLRLLPRAATGQQSSAYVTISTGTATGGPEHHHIILVDNGRSKMLAGKYRDMLRCIRCGACINHCPVYLAVGGLTYASTYPGPMGAVLSPNLFGEGHDDLPQASTLCSACSVACPVKIPLPELMRNLREDQVTQGKQPFIISKLFKLWMWAGMNPTIYRWVELVAYWVLRIASGSKRVVRWLPFASGWFSWRDLQAPKATAPLYHLLTKQQDKL